MNTDILTQEPKKATQGRRWMLTIPARLSDADPGESETGAKLFSPGDLQDALGHYSGFAGQIEQAPETGYLHWQLYLESEAPIRFTTLKKILPQAHLEQAREPRLACVRYCSKDASRVLGPFFHGELRLEDFQGRRKDLETLYDRVMLEGASVDDILMTEPGALRYVAGLRELQAVRDKRTFSTKMRDVECEYWWGVTGAGKTYAAFEEHGFENVYRITDYSVGSFDQYDGESVLVLDEFRGQFPCASVLSMLDRYPYRASARYRDKWAAWTKVIVLSNEPLKSLYREQSGTSKISRETRAALTRRFARERRYTARGVYELTEFDFEPMLPIQGEMPLANDAGDADGDELVF